MEKEKEKEEEEKKCRGDDDGSEMPTLNSHWSDEG